MPQQLNRAVLVSLLKLYKDFIFYNSFVINAILLSFSTIQRFARLFLNSMDTERYCQRKTLKSRSNTAIEIFAFMLSKIISLNTTDT